MNKINLTDEDIIDLIQYTHTTPSWCDNYTQKQKDKEGEKIIQRMSDNAIKWYVNNIVPISGRKITMDKFIKIKNYKK